MTQNDYSTLYNSTVQKIYIKLLRQFYAIYMYMVMSDLSFFFIYNYIYFSFLTSYVSVEIHM